MANNLVLSLVIVSTSSSLFASVVEELKSVCYIVCFVLFLYKFEEANQSFYICGSKVMVLHVAGVDIREISVRRQASKVKIDSNC
jgi:hypothetical protein